MTVQQASKQLLFQLFHIYEEREAKNIADLVMENITEWKRIDRIMNKEVPLSREQEKLLSEYTTALSNHKPVQYVLNEAWFFGMKLYVDENVLIPRPETEELLDWVLEDLRTAKPGSPGIDHNLLLLDIGTGSGCIALGLKKKMAPALVYACDVSNEALAVAKKNSQALDIVLNFIQCDFLKKEAADKLPKVNIIVSNPPYIPMDNQVSMQANVLLHEPHLALFVADNDPLIFYQAIAGFAKTNLIPGGAVFVEIHEEMGENLASLFTRNGFKDIEIRKDLQGKKRMIRAGSLQGTPDS